jgi:gas vesicle protein
MSAKKVVVGTMIGLGTGAALGVLFAPDKGVNIRKKILKKGSQIVGDVKDTANEYVDTLEEGFDNIKGSAVGLGDRVKGAVDSLAGTESPKHTKKA